MKTLITAALTLSSLAFAGTWDIDTAHTQAGFTVKHLGITNVNGTLGPVTGTVEMDDKDVTKSKIMVSIDVKGIDTHVEKRDGHLKSPDFFDVEKFPTATFKSTKIEKGADATKLKITGDLTMHGVTKPVTLDAEMSAEVSDPMFTGGNATRSLTATGTLNREEWDLKWNKSIANNGLVVGKEVKLLIEGELSMKKATPGTKAAAAPAPAKK